MSEGITLSGSALVGVEPHVARGILGAVELPTHVRLGRRPPDPAKMARTPRFARYFDSGLMATPPPASTNRRAKASASLARMYLNDTYGCCVISDRYHSVGLWTGNDGTAPVLGTDAEVLSAYHTICGPGDNGCVITRVLDYAARTGLPFNGVNHKIDGYVSADWTNKLQIQVATYLFGTVALGINLPQAWTQNSVWDVTTSPIVGGHDVPVIDYDDRGVYVASWGRVYLLTWNALRSKQWVEEAWVPLAADWYGDDKVAPSGVDAATLKNDMDIIKAGGVPSIDPVVPPVVPPVNPPPPPPSTHTLTLGMNIRYEPDPSTLPLNGTGNIVGSYRVVARG